MGGRIRNTITGACMLFACLAFNSAYAANFRYKVISPTIFEMQDQLDKFAKEGWRVQSMAPARDCKRLSLDQRRTESVDCFVIVLERSD